jgi:hypothetical protein
MTSDSDSAKRRARRKLLAEVYDSLPSREALNAAADLERVKMQRASQSETFAVQKGSLCVAVLSQVPRDNEENKPVFAAAREVLIEILKREHVRLQTTDDEDTDEIDDGDGASEDAYDGRVAT